MIKITSTKAFKIVNAVLQAILVYVVFTPVPPGAISGLLTVLKISFAILGFLCALINVINIEITKSIRAVFAYKIAERIVYIMQAVILTLLTIPPFANYAYGFYTSLHLMPALLSWVTVTVGLLVTKKKKPRVASVFSAKTGKKKLGKSFLALWICVIFFVLLLTTFFIMRSIEMETRLLVHYNLVGYQRTFYSQSNASSSKMEISINIDDSYRKMFVGESIKPYGIELFTGWQGGAWLVDTVKISSSDPDILEVNGSFVSRGWSGIEFVGEIRAKKPGTAKIIIDSGDDHYEETVTVIGGENVRLSWEDPDYDFLEYGGYYYQVYSKKIPLGKGFYIYESWTSFPHGLISYSVDDPSIATLSNDGKIIGKKIGKCNLVCSYDGKTFKLPISVVSPVSGERVQQPLAITETCSVFESLYLFDNTLKSNFEFKSNAPIIASVDQNGKIQAINIGKADIIATYVGEDGTTCEFTIPIRVDEPILYVNGYEITKVIKFEAGSSVRLSNYFKSNVSGISLNDFEVIISNGGLASATLSGYYNVSETPCVGKITLLYKHNNNVVPQVFDYEVIASDDNSSES